MQRKKIFISIITICLSSSVNYKAESRALALICNLTEWLGDRLFPWVRQPLKGWGNQNVVWIFKLINSATIVWIVFFFNIFVFFLFQSTTAENTPPYTMLMFRKFIHCFWNTSAIAFINEWVQKKWCVTQMAHGLKYPPAKV